MRPEIEITPKLKKWIQEGIDEHGYNVDLDLVCYYIQFGVDAPRPPKLSEEAQGWLAQLKKRHLFDQENE